MVSPRSVRRRDYGATPITGGGQRGEHQLDACPETAALVVVQLCDRAPLRVRRNAELTGAELAPRMWARIVPVAEESSGTLERTGWLTPYTAETIREDAVRAGPGTRLER